jgi:eukaryotic-like serine/threonine-protein kinase
LAETRITKLGRYRILSELGRGNMGVVYKAKDTLLDRTVAVKTIILSEDPHERAQYEARFHQEAKAAGGFSHPNLITIFDAGREGNVAYMAMELLDGIELRDLMKDRRLPLPQALDIIAQVADGLAFVHERGITHRDIKPGNVMIMPDGRARIMDFGIARMRVSEIETQAGTILGSPRYMSPEQVTSQRADHRSDIFSLGVVLYELAAGEPPFVAKNLSALMHQVASATPRPPSVVDAALPPVLDFIVARALEKEPEARYQSAAELAADLRACRAQLAARAVNKATVRGNVDLTTTMKIDSATVAPRTREAASATMKSTTLRVGDLASHLTLSRRFDSRVAYQRIMRAGSSDATQAALPPIGRSASSQWLYDPGHRTLAAALAAAAIAAVAIALI